MREISSSYITEEGTMLTIAQIEKRKDLVLLQDPLEVETIQRLVGSAAYPYTGFFVKSDDGGYIEIFGFEGFVCNPEKAVERIL